MAAEETNQRELIQVGEKLYDPKQFTPRAQELFMALQSGTQARAVLESLAKLSGEGWQSQFDDFAKLLPDPVEQEGAEPLLESDEEEEPKH